MKLKIIGRPISKKNNRRNFRNISLPPKAYGPFEKSAVQQLSIYNIKYTGLLKVHYVFHMKGRLDTDVDNMMAGINDILQVAGIIENDKFIIDGTFKKVAGCTDWLTEVEIHQI